MGVYARIDFRGIRIWFLHFTSRSATYNTPGPCKLTPQLPPSLQTVRGQLRMQSLPRRYTFRLACCHKPDPPLTQVNMWIHDKHPLEPTHTRRIKLVPSGNINTWPLFLSTYYVPRVLCDYSIESLQPSPEADTLAQLYRRWKWDSGKRRNLPSSRPTAKCPLLCPESWKRVSFSR